jgi:hypothetical protein
MTRGGCGRKTRGNSTTRGGGTNVTEAAQESKSKKSDKTIWKNCPITVILLLCKLMDNCQTCSTPITSPTPKKGHSLLSPKQIIIQTHHQ